MALSNWEEIKKLAADFQKAQLGTTSQRLSERNCVEIVSKLIELKLVEVIFTCDGKEYLTSDQLTKEIRDELYVHGGRINIVDLAKYLNIDLNQVNNNVAEITKKKECQLISGYLITDYYLEKIAKEINEKLQFLGQITVGDLSLQYDLPADLLHRNVLDKYLGKIIKGIQDVSNPRVYYTEEYIIRTKAKINGALIGLLKPTPVSVIINHCNLTDRLFMSLFDQLTTPGSLTGRQTGALYIPFCYTKSQNDWVINFYKQNNYLEYDALIRLGISDPRTYIKKTFPNENLCYLNSCAIGSLIKESLESALEDCIASKSYLDIVSLLPSIMSDEDIEIVIDIILKSSSKSVILIENTAFSHDYIENLRQSCQNLVHDKANAVVKSGEYQQFYLEKKLSRMCDTNQEMHVDHKAERREERKKKATSGKGGGGTQGRETKTKAIKKHSRSSKHDTSSENDSTQKSHQQLEIVSVKDIENVIVEALEKEGLEDLTTHIAEQLHMTLKDTALNLAKEMSNKLLQDANQNKKQSHSSAQDKINMLVNDIKLYEKGIKIFAPEQQTQFIKYLLKTLGGEVLAEFCKYAASQCNISVQSDSLSIEQKNKIINELSEEFAKPMHELNKSLSDLNMESFYQAVDSCLSCCGMILKKVDKKKDKALVQNHREKLILELDNCDDAALSLHLAVLAIFTLSTQQMLHASGRLVPVIMSYLKTRLKEEEFEKLQEYYELVTKCLTSTEEVRPVFEDKLKELMPSIKNIIKDIKKEKQMC